MLSCICDLNRGANLQAKKLANSQNWKTRQKVNLKTQKEKDEQIFFFSQRQISGNYTLLSRQPQNAGLQNTVPNLNGVMAKCVKSLLLACLNG